MSIGLFIFIHNVDTLLRNLVHNKKTPQIELKRQKKQPQKQP